MTTHTDGHETKRTDEHAAMLKEALARPGMREVMEVYGGWRRADKALEAYRAARRRAWIVTTSDRTNPLPQASGILGPFADHKLEAEEWSRLVREKW